MRMCMLRDRERGVYMYRDRKRVYVCREVERERESGCMLRDRERGYVCREIECLQIDRERGCGCVCREIERGNMYVER